MPEFKEEDFYFWEMFIWNPGFWGYLDDNDLEFAPRVM